MIVRLDAFPNNINMTYVDMYVLLLAIKVNAYMIISMFVILHVQTQLMNLMKYNISAKIKSKEKLIILIHKEIFLKNAIIDVNPVFKEVMIQIQNALNAKMVIYF